jgi:hypothetical protein
VLTPPGARLGFRKLFLFGVGESGADETALAERVAEALGKLAQAGVQEAAMQLPARLSPEAGIRALVDAVSTREGAGDPGPQRAMIFGPDPQRLIAALSQAAMRGQAQLERRVVKVPGTVSSGRPPPPSMKQQQRPMQASITLPRASPPAFAPQRDLPKADIPPPPAPEMPKASPLPFAKAEPSTAKPAEPPQPDAPVAPPASQPDEEVAVAPVVPASEPPPAPVQADAPKAEPAAIEPPKVEQPQPKVELPKVEQPTLEPPKEAEKPRTPPPPPQRYVPQEPTQNVFDRKRHKKR